MAPLLWFSARTFTNPRKPYGHSKFSGRCLWFALLLSLAATTSPGQAQSLPTLQFAMSSCTVVESADTATLAVQRLGDTTTVVRVDYATADYSAAAGLNYTATRGTLVFAAGETNKLIVVPILNEGFVEGTKTFRVVLSNPAGAVLGTYTTALVSIADNDVGIAFQFATYSVAEDAGTVRIGVVRGDDGTLPVTVDWATTDLTATSGRDYAGSTNTLAFGPTERLKFVSIPILNNSLKQPSRSFGLILSHPTGGTLGGTTTTTVTVLDKDPGFQFESASCTVAEDAGAVLLRVLRN